MPKFNPSRSRRSAISWSDFLPKFLTCRIWLSVWRTRSPSVRMFEFFRELTDRTESSRSSIGVLSSWGRRAAPGRVVRQRQRRRRVRAKLDEVLEVRLREGSRVAHRLFRGDGAIRLDGQRQAIVRSEE